MTKPRSDSRVQIHSLFKTASDTMVNGSASSVGIDKRGYNAVGLLLPTLTSAAYGFKVSTDNSTWVRLRNAAAASTFIATTTGSMAVSGSMLDLLQPWPYVMLMGSAGQAASRALTWVLQG